MSGQGITAEGDDDRLGTKQVQQRNAVAARAVGEIVKTTLGPNGMEKMIVDDTGDVTITSDGSTVIEELSFENPFAGLVSTVGLSQQIESGDGTTTAITIATELLTEVETLLERDIHPTPIVEGFRVANEIARTTIEDQTYELDAKGEDLLQKAIASRLPEIVADERKGALATQITAVVEEIVAEAPGEYADRIAIESNPGRWIGDIERVAGAVVEKKPFQRNMPTDFDSADILLIDTPLEVGDSEHATDIEVDSFDTYDQQIEHEKRRREDVFDQILATGADVVFCQKGVDDGIANRLASESVLVTEFTIKPDLEFLARLLGVEIVGDTDGLTEEDLGQASVSYDDDASRFHVEVPSPTARTLLLHGSTQRVADKLKDSVREAIDLGVVLASERRVVAGAGAIEMEQARQIREAAKTEPSRKQVAMEAYADALEVVPRVLAENAGHDPLTTLVDLRSAHADGDAAAGVDVAQGGVLDAFEGGVVDIPSTKANAIINATEAANIVTHIDDVVPAKSLSNGQ